MTDSISSVSLVDLPESTQVDIMEIEHYIDQATRWINGTFDRFVDERPDLGNKYARAKWEIDMGLSHCRHLLKFVRSKTD